MDNATLQHLPQKETKELLTFVEHLKSQMGGDLDSIVLYGSAVRGNFREGVSDVNVLIVLKESVPRLHAIIAEGIDRAKVQIEPFIVAKKVLGRALDVFAVKFQSIQRQHAILCGNSPFRDLKPDLTFQRFLAEQTLLNLRFRTVRAFVMIGRERKRYSHFIKEVVTPLFIDLSEPLRCEGIAIPEEFVDRIPVFQKEYDVDGEVFKELLAFHDSPRKLSSDEVLSFYSRLFLIFEQVTNWTEHRWTKS